MEFANLILNFLLLFSNDILLMFLSMMLYIFSKRDDYKYLILLLLFVMIFKTILKDLFKIPPPVTSPSSNYAFPSGHIYFATVFYLWIAFYKHLLKFGLFALIALMLTSFAIVFKGYHELREIILTFLLGALTVFTYNKFSKIIFDKGINIFLLLAIILYMLSSCVFEKTKIDIIIGVYGTLGFIFGLSLKQNFDKFLTPILGLLICYLFTSDIRDFIEGLIWCFVFFIPSGIIKQFITSRKNV